MLDVDIQFKDVCAEREERMCVCFEDVWLTDKHRCDVTNSSKFTHTSVLLLISLLIVQNYTQTLF